MEIEKSRNGFYTLTFLNKNNVDEEDILKDFNTVGNVCKIVQNFQRIFIRFKEKEEAERALKKFKTVYDVDMAKNNKTGDYQHEGFNQNHSHNHRSSTNHIGNLVKSLEMSSSSRSIEKINCTSKVFHLILANLPRNYTIKDVNALVEEATPVCINQLDETRVFNVKFCHIVLDSIENLTYLIDKLNGFVISGEKLMAAEARHLLEWREKAV